MKKFLILLFLLSITTLAFAYTRQYDWSTGDDITAARLNADLDNLESEGILATNLASDSVTSAKILNGTIVGADLSSSITITGGIWNGTDIAQGYGGIGSNRLQAGCTTIPANGTKIVTFTTAFGSAPTCTATINQNTISSTAYAHAIGISAHATTTFTLTNPNESVSDANWICFGSE